MEVSINEISNQGQRWLSLIIYSTPLSASEKTVRGGKDDGLDSAILSARLSSMGIGTKEGICISLMMMLWYNLDAAMMPPPLYFCSLV